MATLLSQYQEQQKRLLEKLDAGKLAQDNLLALQELNYSSLRSLLSERKFGPKADEKGMKQRQAAAKSLEDVFNDQSRRFQSFKASSPELYRKSVQSMVNTVLPVWVTYRGTYINIEEAFA